MFLVDARNEFTSNRHFYYPLIKSPSLILVSHHARLLRGNRRHTGDLDLRPNTRDFLGGICCHGISLGICCPQGLEASVCIAYGAMRYGAVGSLTVNSLDTIQLG